MGRYVDYGDEKKIIGVALDANLEDKTTVFFIASKD